jgi:general secretion pathway protein F
MAAFRYKAVNAEGGRLEGEVVAESEREAARLLERRGLSVLVLEPAIAAQGGGKLGRGRRRLAERDVVLALHELATLLASGVALAEAVAAQSRSAHHPRLLQAFDAIGNALRQGQPFSDALLATGLSLPEYVGTLIRSGEKAGQLGKALQDAVAQMEYDMQVRGEIRQALTYPAVLVTAGFGAVVLMFTFVVPKFAALLERAEDLPWLGWAVLSGGMLAREYWWLILAVVVGLALLATRALADPTARARGYERLERLPVIGTWRLESETASWARVLATLLGNRVPLLDALGLAQAAVKAPGRRVRLEEVSRSVRAGSTLADALEEQRTLTATGYNLVRVGERSGELPAMLRSLAKLCEDAGRARMKQFLALLEPLAILVIGSVIGVIMIGIILAITSANDIAL